MKTSSRGRGFTLIELMLVVAIIGILAAIAVPKFAEMVRKSKEGATKGNLGALRSALSIYYAENEGNFPNAAWSSNSNVFSAYLAPKYIKQIPQSNVPGYHAPSTNVFAHWDIFAGDEHDGTGWIYDSILPADTNFGVLWVACSHTDTKGTQWTSY